MELLLIEFINTLDLSLKNLQKELGKSSSFSSLTIHQLQYVDTIHELGTPTITEIANRMNITKASVTAGVNRLVDMGYLTKTQSEEDKRVFHVNLTEAGQILTRAKSQALKEYGDFIMDALSEEEAQQFESILTKLVAYFKG